MTFLIESDGLTKSFGATPVLKGVSFSVSPGEFVCVWDLPARGNRPCFTSLAS